MGHIKSALEIALERTADIPVDKTAGESRELKNRGKRAANEYLDGGTPETFTAAFKETTPERIKYVQEGAASIFLASVKLPVAETDTDRMQKSGSGIALMAPETGMEELFSQLALVLAQYLQDLEQTETALKQQFIPRLRAKQQEMAQRYGQNVPLEPHQDSEYMATLGKNIRMIEDRYAPVLDEVRARIREAIGMEE